MTATTQDDPRLGKASASRLEIVALCPGSEPLRKTLPAAVIEAAGDDDEYAQTGRKIHYARQTRQTLQLLPEEVEIYERGVATEKRILDKWVEDFAIESYDECEPELRLYLNHPENLTPIASGQLDVHYTGKSSREPGVFVLVIDWKALWSPNLTPAERNWQGKLQSVMVQIEYDAVHVRMAFNKAMFGSADQVDYTTQGIIHAGVAILQALWEAEQPGAQRRPGRWCTHCPCKAYCEDAVAYAQLPTLTTGPIKPNGSPATPEELVLAMPVEDLVPVWRKKNIVEKIFKQITERLKALPGEELVRLGLKLAPGRKLDKLKDVKGAFVKLIRDGFDEDECFRIMSFGKEAAVKLIQSKRGWTKEQAETWWEEAMSEFTEQGNAKPSLKEA